MAGRPPATARMRQVKATPVEVAAVKVAAGEVAAVVAALVCRRGHCLPVMPTTCCCAASVLPMPLACMAGATWRKCCTPCLPLTRGPFSSRRCPTRDCLRHRASVPAGRHLRLLPMARLLDRLLLRMANAVVARLHRRRS